MIGEHSSFSHRSTCGERCSQRSDYRVTRAGHVKYFTGRRPDINRIAVSLDQHHSTIASRDQNGVTTQALANHLGGPSQSAIGIFFQAGHWHTVGRAVFNMNPDEALVHFKNQYERVGP